MIPFDRMDGGIPRFAGVGRVLDVGCSQGATAPALRAAGVREIVGIEPHAGDVDAARTGYDRLIEERLEDVREAWDAAFDAILFGGILEHLEDPSDALVRVRPWLAPGGRVVASVPNAASGAVIGGLLEERLDGALGSPSPGEALRLFTRRSLVDLFEACGYAVESIEGVVGDPSPEGRALLAKLASIPDVSPDPAVLAWIVVARPVPAPL